MPQGLDQVVGSTLVSVRNGPGMRLRAAREAKGISALDIAQELRLHPDVIRRIEEDDYDNSLPLVFIKGYLRAFAGLVGVDQDQVIIEFMHLGMIDPVKQLGERLGATPKKLSQFQQDAHRYRPWIIGGLIAVVIAGICAFMWYQSSDTEVDPAALMSESMIAPPMNQPPLVMEQPAIAPENAQAQVVAPQAANDAAPVMPSPAPVVVEASAAPKPVVVPMRAKPKSQPMPQEKIRSEERSDDDREEAMLF